MQAAIYWADTGDPNAGDRAIRFHAGTGAAGSALQTNSYLAVAVRNVDLVVAVPEPQTWAMLLMGLGAVTAAVRRRQS